MLPCQSCGRSTNKEALVFLKEKLLSFPLFFSVTNYNRVMNLSCTLSEERFHCMLLERCPRLFPGSAGMLYIQPGFEYCVSCTSIELHGHRAWTGSCLLIVGSVLSNLC